MLQLTKNELQKFAAETGFQKNPLEKVLRLLNILAALQKHPYLNC